MRYRITHRTEYSYTQPVKLCHNEARLQPRTTDYQRCELAHVIVDPAPAVCGEREDIFGNRVAYFNVEDEHQELVVTATSEVERWHPPYSGLEQSPPWEAAVGAVRAAADHDARAAQQFVLDSPSVETSAELSRYALGSFTAGRPLLEAIIDLASRIHREFEFDPERTTVKTHLSEVLEHRGGVCQDFAHLGIGCLRSLGLPARYVSGYLETLPPPGKPKLVGADASHAWLAAFVPGLGWISIDPTNDQRPDDRYVTIGWGRDYTDVTPLKGVLYGGGTHTLKVGVDMKRVDETETAAYT